MDGDHIVPEYSRPFLSLILEACREAMMRRVASNNFTVENHREK